MGVHGMEKRSRAMQQRHERQGQRAEKRFRRARRRRREIRSPLFGIRPYRVGVVVCDALATARMVRACSPRLLHRRYAASRMRLSSRASALRGMRLPLWVPFALNYILYIVKETMYK